MTVKYYHLFHVTQGQRGHVTNDTVINIVPCLKTKLKKKKKKKKKVQEKR